MDLQSAIDARYVLVTAAYNEERHISKTIESVIAQTVRPLRWVIVSDGSTDRTDDIVLSYSKVYPFIQLKRLTEEHPRNFSAQVFAINAGCREVANLDFGFIGNLDADISFHTGYYECVLQRFAADSKLGVSGGFIFEQTRTGFRSRSCNCSSSVAHAIQLFRRGCFEQVGGYVPLLYGGPDWFAEVRARQFGWKVVAHPDLSVYHHRRTAGAEGLVPGRLRQGRMDYSFGSLLSFELLKCIRRLRERPPVIGAMIRFYGFASSYLRRAPRLLPDDFVEYLRREQSQRMMALFNASALLGDGLHRSKRIDNAAE